MNTPFDTTDNEIRSQMAKKTQSEIQTQTVFLMEILKQIGEEIQKNKSVQVENIVREIVGKVSIERPDWIKELLPNTSPIEKKLDYIASAIIRKEVVRKMDFNRPNWIDELKPKDIKFPEAKDFSKPQTDLLTEILTELKSQEYPEEVSIKGEVGIKQPKWWKLPDFEKPILSLATFLKGLQAKIFKVEVQNEITVKNPVEEITVKNPQKEVKISNLGKVEEKLDLVTAQLRGLGNTGSNGGGIDTSKIATEETLQAVAGMNYDTTSVDLSDMSNIVITYKLSGTTIATETITKTGSVYNIIKS
jgi:hypothetical protein